MASLDPMDDLLDAFADDLPDEAEVGEAATRIARARRARPHTLWWVAALLMIGVGAVLLARSPQPATPAHVDVAPTPAFAPQEAPAPVEEPPAVLAGTDAPLEPRQHTLPRAVLIEEPTPFTPEPIVAEVTRPARSSEGLDLAEGTVATWRGDELVLESGMVTFVREGTAHPRAERLRFAALPAVAWPAGTVFVASAVGDVGLLAIQSGEVYVMEVDGGPVAKLEVGDSVAIAEEVDGSLRVVSLTGVTPDGLGALLPADDQQTAGLAGSVIALRLAALSATAKAELLREAGG